MTGEGTDLGEGRGTMRNQLAPLVLVCYVGIVTLNQQPIIIQGVA